MTALHFLFTLNIVTWLANVALFIWQVVNRRDDWFDTCDCTKEE